MRRPFLFAAAFASGTALAAVTVQAAHAPLEPRVDAATPAPTKFPVSGRDYRRWVDSLIATMRQASSSAEGPMTDEARNALEDKIRHVNDRTREVTADDVVTKKEHQYVLGALRSSDSGQSEP